MREIIPRFEFRAFAQSFCLVAKKMRRYSKRCEIDESRETYLLTLNAENQNVKVRQNKIEIKRLIEQRGPLECWNPVGEEILPASPEFLLDTILPALGLGEWELSRSEYSLQQLLDEIVNPRRGLWSAAVFKRRFRLSIGDCPTEIDELLINGAAIRSAAVESEDPDTVEGLIAELGLGEYENINYPRAIRRIMGLERILEEHTYG